MSRWPERARARRHLLAFCLGAVCAWAGAADRFPGVGRPATPAEVSAWDIDVRPDFKGLPAGAGSVAQGQAIWETQCASCHGVFGESNQVFAPIIGGTTADDVKNGRVARLTDPAYPGRTTLMKVATLSTLWDYINRAMPWNQPKSLTADEVYAVMAFLLHLGNVVPDNFTLTDSNMAEVQARMPNRNGMTTDHALWPGRGLASARKPDVAATACMRDCAGAVTLASTLPDFARNQHGNLAAQSRLVGAQRGADTTRPEPPANAAVAAVLPTQPPPAVEPAAAPARTAGTSVDARAAQALAAKYACTACHGLAQKIIGPGFAEIARRHAGKADYLTGKIRAGGSGAWGPIPMPAQTLSESEARMIAQWIAAGASR